MSCSKKSSLTKVSNKIRAFIPGESFHYSLYLQVREEPAKVEHLKHLEQACARLLNNVNEMRWCDMEQNDN